MLRARLNEGHKAAMKARDQVATATLRLILAALKDRDIAARAKGNTEGIDEAEILQMLQGMIRQRRESIALYEQGGRLDLVEEEKNEIEVIERYLPKPLGEDEVKAAIEAAIGEVGAASLKDMGKVMAALKAKFAGRMDFAQVSAKVKERLS
ncbi:MAG: GatB/YqeY domain-containing protein [Proteobacteria bacterium]|nr:GatB/YqeY domain-containing protein [Pseudomonadota bacterium]